MKMYKFLIILIFLSGCAIPVDRAMHVSPGVTYSFSAEGIYIPLPQLRYVYERDE